MFSATSIVSYMGTLAIFLIFLGPAYATTGFNCNNKMHNITTISFADLMYNVETSHNIKVFAAEHPDDFACIFMNHPGYTAIVKADKFHIIECKPVLVELQPQNECYDRLPIVQGNQRLFLNPWTLIITDNANEISCVAPILEDHQLDGITYKVKPRPVSPLVPQRLKSKIESTWQWHDLDNLWDSGIYSEDEVNRAWEYQRHPEQFDPPPRRVFKFPNPNANLLSITYDNNRDHNRGSNPWYHISDAKDLIVMVAVAISVVLLLTCIVKMVVDRVKHGSAFHSINQCRRRRQTRSNQVDLTIRLNKPPDV